ncbi:MAG: hypothetical protein KC492_35000, partial [Myxococcales bacterium]|nr:hypothetical protein [Myxococcales bacterium]
LPRSAWGSTLEQDPGSVEIVATGHRLKAFRRRLVLEEGAKEQVAVRVARLPTAYLRVEYAQKPSGMGVQFDGRAVAVEFLEETSELDPGDHTLVVTAPGFSEFRWARSLKNAERTLIKVSLTPKPGSGAGTRGTPRWLFWSVTGVSVAALAGGSYFTLSAASRDAEERDKDPLVRDPGLRDEINGQARTGNLLFIGGGVFALGAGVLAFTTDWGTPTSERATARRWIRTSGRGIWVGGSF